MSARALVTLVLALAGGLAGCSDPGPRLEAASDVERCQQQLRRIYAGLLEYEKQKGHAPPSGGARFFAALIADGVWRNTAENAALLSCPGVGDAALGLAAVPPMERFAALERVTGASSAYAGRDVERWPLTGVAGPGSEPLVACDNHLGPNHANLTNVLFADGSIATLELDRLKSEGLLPADADRVPIGPGAPTGILGGALVKLSQD